MLRALFKAMIRGYRRGANKTNSQTRTNPNRFAPSLFPLEAREVPAVTASFLAGSGTLSVFGDNLDNTITISRNAAGQILVNGGAVAVTGGTPTVANTALIQVFGQGGNDVIQGGFSTDSIFAGGGNDTIQVLEGEFIDHVNGESGLDTLDLSNISSRPANINLDTGIWDLSPTPENEGKPASPNTGTLLQVTRNRSLRSVVEGLDRPTSLELIGHTAFVVTLTGKIIAIDPIRDGNPE